jgi:hypothetical protein
MHAKHVALLAVIVFTVVGCGDTTTPLKFESGTYSVSNLPVFDDANDACMAFLDYNDHADQLKVKAVVGVLAEGSTETALPLTIYRNFDGTDQPAEARAVGTLDGGTISATISYDDFYDPNVASDCEVTFINTYSGSVTADNVASVTMTHEERWLGTGCTVADTGWTTSCTSTATITITNDAIPAAAD